MSLYGFSCESWHNLPWQNSSHTVRIHRACVLYVSSGVASVHLLEETLYCTGHIGNYWPLCVFPRELPDDFFVWSSCRSVYTCMDVLQYDSVGALPVNYLTGISFHRSHSQISFLCHALPANGLCTIERERVIWLGSHLSMIFQTSWGIAVRTAIRTDVEFPSSSVGNCQTVNSLLMAAQILLVLETLGTMRANKRPVARVMRGFVIFQRVWSSKLLIADVTLVWPFICV